MGCMLEPYILFTCLGWTWFEVEKATYAMI